MVATETTRPFRPTDLLRQVLITSLDLSPDAEDLVYARRTIEGGRERSRLMVVPFDGGRPRPLTTAAVNDTSPVWSPDGRRIAFCSDRGSDGAPGTAPQVWTIATDGGEPCPAAPLPAGATRVSWSPDGTRLLALGPSGEQRFVIGDPKDPIARRVTELTWRFDGRGIRDQHASAWVLPALEGRPVRATDATADVGQAIWSPDGDRIAFTADRSPEGAIYESPTLWSARTPDRGGRPHRPRPLGGEGPVHVLTAAWGRRAVALTGWTERVAAWHPVGLWLAGPDATVRVGADLDLTFWPFAWSELVPSPWPPAPVFVDGERLVVLGNVRGRCTPFLVRVDDPEAPPRQLLDGDTDVVQLATAGGRVAAIASVGGDAAAPYELDLDENRLRRVTSDPSRWFAGWRREPEEFVVRHHGVEVQGWLTRARGRERERRPLILEIHGGPYDAAGPTRLCEELAMADAGFHVLAMNPRGSIGFGAAHAEALHGAWGVPDAQDLLASVDSAVRRGLADRRRIGLFGLSYGGFMTVHLLGTHPGRFAAAVAENPFVSAFADLGACDVGQMMEPETGVGPWPEDLQGWLAISPIVRIHRNEAPLLLLQGDEDHRCPPTGTETVFAILRRQGTPVEMIRYPGEFHTMVVHARADRRVDRMERILDWFGRHL
jgi:dipeptidyl aminopeptidase/acylaminoacyl peptidase